MTYSQTTSRVFGRSTAVVYLTDYGIHVDRQMIGAVFIDLKNLSTLKTMNACFIS